MFDIYINGNLLNASNYGVQRIREALLELALWKQLLFEICPLDEELGSITLVLLCKVFADILGDFKFAENVATLEKLHFTFKYYTPCTLIYYSCFFNNLQYTLSSALFSLESEYPFIFSYYGKHLFEINYSTLLKLYTELNTPLEGPGQPDRAEMLQLVLDKLDYFLLTTYNTIEVMKECDKSSYRLQQCRKSISRPRQSDDMRLLRNFAFIYRMLALDSAQSDPKSCV